VPQSQDTSLKLVILAEAFLEKIKKLQILLIIHQTLQVAQIRLQTQAALKKL
jgi:hypothetical protein